MSYQYHFLEAAQLEYEEAVEWYLQRSPKAANGFINSVEETLKLICNNPNRWRNEYNNFHELGVRKYPYSLVYLIETELQRVIITAVFHGKRTPLNKYIV
jgi:plasmid stabilization system protein ParE